MLFRSGEIDGQVKLLKPGDSVRLSVFRYDQLREIEMKADGQADGKWVVRRMKSPTAGQKAVYESWLGAAWSDAKEAGKGTDVIPVDH